MTMTFVPTAEELDHRLAGTDWNEEGWFVADDEAELDEELLDHWAVINEETGQLETLRQRVERLDAAGWEPGQPLPGTV